MNREHIAAGQLVSILLTSRLVSSMTFAPTLHQFSHGTDFLLSLLLQLAMLAVLLLPTCLFLRRGGSVGTLDYSYAVFGRGGAAVAVGYTLLCLFVQLTDLLRFRRFVSTTLSPDMPATLLCIVLVLGAGVAAYYGIQAIARCATIVAFFVTITIVLLLVALLPRMERINFPPLLYDGFSPVLSGAWEELPRTLELALIGLFIPYVKGSVPKSCLLWSVLFTVFALIIQITVVGTLGDFGIPEPFPYTTAVKAAQFGVLQRMDSLATSVWVAALFIKMSFFGVMSIECLSRLFSPRYRIAYTAGGAALVLSVGLLFVNGLPLAATRTVIWGISAGALALGTVLLPLWLSLGRKRA